MNVLLRLALVLLGPSLLVPPYLASAQTVQTCFKVDGSAKPAVEGWLPCNPDAGASPCCNKDDYCMSNGLCLNAVGNNFIALQGCTSSNWDAPCNKVCNGSTADSGGISLVWLCTPLDINGNVGYCCSDSPTCCEGDLFAIPIATSVWHPPQAQVTTSTSAGASSETVSQSRLTTAFPTSSPYSATTSPPTESGTSLASGGNNTTNTTGTSTTTLAIGLGVGIPVGLALAGALFFIGWQLRKRNHVAAVAYDPRASPKHEPATATTSHIDGWKSHEQSPHEAPATAATSRTGGWRSHELSPQDAPGRTRYEMGS